MLASVLSRRLLPRTAAALHGALPAAALAAPPASPSPRSFSASSDAKIGRDALADILCKEYGLKMSESRRIMDTVFDTIVEVRDANGDIRLRRGVGWCNYESWRWCMHRQGAWCM